jgi:cell division protease FtsH
MNETLGTVSYLSGGEVFIGRDYQQTKSYSESVAGTIDREVKLLIDKAYKQCEEILKKDETKLKAVVDYLMQNETMTGEQFAACMAGEQIGEASETALFDSHSEE